MRRIGTALLILIIISFNIIIGSNDVPLRIWPIGILFVLSLIYLIIYKLLNKKNNIIFKNKIDYLIFLFMIIISFPILFKTYASLSDSISFLLKYYFIYITYLVARNTINNKKQINILIITTLISSLIPVILDFKFLQFGIIKKITEFLKFTYKEGSEFSGTFGYANTLAVYLSFCIFLSLHLINNTDKKMVKILSIIYIIFASIIIILTKAKFIIIVTIFALLILYIKRYKTFILKHIKVYIGSIVGLLIISIIFLLFAVSISKPIVKNGEDIDVGIKYNFKKGETYKLDLNIKADCKKPDYYKYSYAYKIVLYEGNKYFNEYEIASTTFITNDGYISLDFTPTFDTDFIRLKVYNNSKGNITINDAKINDKEYILNYKYIPNTIGYMLHGFINNGQSLQQRSYIYHDCIKIFKLNPFFGNGGNAWRQLSSTVEEYDYQVKETHSYFFELLISYGLIGVISFLGILLVLIKKIINILKKDTYKKYIVIGLIIILLHSLTFDFNMSFMLIQIILYIFISILYYDDKNNSKTNILELITFIILLFIGSLYVRINISNFFMKDYKNKYNMYPYSIDNRMKNIIYDESSNVKELLDKLDKIIDDEPYNYQTDVYQVYFRLIVSGLNELNDEELNYYFNSINNKMTNTPATGRMNKSSIYKRIKFYVDLKKYLTNNNPDNKTSINDEIKTIDTIMNKEINNVSNRLKELDKSGMTEQDYEQYIKTLNNANEGISW